MIFLIIKREAKNMIIGIENLKEKQKEKEENSE